MRKERIPVVFFSIAAILLAISPLIYLFRGEIGLWDALLTIAVCITFLAMGYMILCSYTISRDPLYAVFFLALFIWPFILAAITFSISGAAGLAKKGLENKMGGFGDPVSSLLLLDDLVFGAKLIRLSLFLMFITNALLLAPFSIIYRRVRNTKATLAEELNPRELNS